MVIDNTPINMNKVLIENVEGLSIPTWDNTTASKKTRIMTGWTAYAKHRDLFKSIHAICLNRQVYNSCVLPDTTYGAEKWTLTEQARNKLTAAQSKMERRMLSTTYKDIMTSIWDRERTKVIDKISNVRTLSETREGR